MAAQFASKVVLVTGGAQGIGLGIAQEFQRQGAQVVLIDVQEALLRAAVEDAGKWDAAHPAPEMAVLNVTEAAAVTEAFDGIAAKHGSLDILVQAAGIVGKTGIKTHEVDPDDFDRVVAINLKGIFLCCRAALPHMLKKNWGRIINIASISGKEGNAGMLAYSTSKAGVVGLTKVIGKEYAETGITCNALAPAVILTSMVEAMPEEQVKYMTDKIPMKRTGKIPEIAAMVTYE